MFRKKIKESHITDRTKRLVLYVGLMGKQKYAIGTASEISKATWIKQSTVYDILKKLGLRTQEQKYSLSDQAWARKHRERLEYLETLRRIFRNV